MLLVSEIKRGVMFSKLDDKNLKICKIHHKRKVNKNKIIKISTIVLVIVVAFSTGALGLVESGALENTAYQLVWSDEFSGTGLNSGKWYPRVDTGTWSYYPSMISINNGNLVLSATKENGIYKYGGIISKSKYNFKYGYIEIRAKVPKGNGFLSGLWLTGQYSWPPEIDILEHLGKEPTAIYMTRHCSTLQDSTCTGGSFLGKEWWKYLSKRYVGNDWSTGYHLYGVEWTPTYVRWLIDGVERYRVTTGVPKQPMWITLSLCVNNCAGGWSGPVDSSTVLPNRMYVDYVRVYQTNTATSPAITTISPNGGENLLRGTTKTVSWASTGNTGQYVKMELLKGGVLNKVITSSTPNDGTYSWTIPSTQPLGSDYKIKIISTSSSISDTSNSNFAITTPKIVTTSPNGGEYWTRGTTKTISWSSTGSTGQYVKIELLKSGILNRVITSSTPNDGSYSWYIPSTQTLGTDYKIKVTSTGNSAYTDSSNYNFAISGPKITVSSPNGGEYWTRSSTRTIKWSSYGNPGAYVKIELYKGGMFNKVIISSTPNDGTYSWYIPSTQLIGSDYKIKITSTSNSAYNDWSNYYFKIY